MRKKNSLDVLRIPNKEVQAIFLGFGGGGGGGGVKNPPPPPHQRTQFHKKGEPKHSQISESVHL